MNLPQIIDTVTGYVFSWNKEQITIEVSRLHNHSDGRVTGEIAVSTSLQGYNSHLHQAQFNFAATRSRSELARNLSERYPNLVKWADILEQLCVYTLERVRKGEPVIELQSGDDVHPPEYLLEPIILKSYPTIIFGDPGSAKSTTALILSQIMACPWDDYSLDLIPHASRVNCIYLDYETSADTIRWLLTKLQRGMNTPPLRLNYRHCALPLAQDVDQIHRHIYDTKSEVIIIDSLGLACGGDLKEPAPALSFFAALRQLKVTSLILAHTSKNADTKKKTVFGSVFFEAQARSVWEIWKRQDVDEDEMDIALFHRKPPPFQKLCKPIGFQLKFGIDTIVVSPGKPRTVAEFLAGLSTQMQIVEVLKRGALSTKELTETLSLSRSAADSALKRLKDKGKIVKVTDKWGLMENEFDE
jgi:hypothetical protein